MLRRLAAAGCLAAAAVAVQAQSIEAQLAHCRGIDSDQARLACFDQAADAASSALPAPVPVPAEAPAPPGPLTGAWDLDRIAGRDAIDILPYRTSYVLPFTYGDRKNTEPFLPTDEPVDESVGLQKEEAQFQLSFKLRLVDTLFGEDGDIWFGYTQRSFWQIYNKPESRPFRETNYEPELMVTFPVDYNAFGLRGGLLGVALNHQSNGQADPLSRSWNRLIGIAGFETADMSLLARLWYRIPESGKDDNPDIEDYMGQGDLLFTWQIGEHELEALIKSNFVPDDLKAGLQLNWSGPFPGTDAIRWYAQYYYGYGESMIDQEFRVNRIGVGVALAEWY